MIENRGWCFKTHFKTTLGHQGAFIHKSLFEKLGYYDESFRITMDYEWFMRAFRQNIPVSRHPEILSIMSDGGLSSRKDWPSLSQRFQEEKRVHRKYAASSWWSILYAVYWGIYPTYRKLQHRLSNDS